MHEGLHETIEFIQGIDGTYQLQEMSQVSRKSAAPRLSLAFPVILVIQLLHSCLPHAAFGAQEPSVAPTALKLMFSVYCFNSDFPRWLFPCQVQPHLSLSG